MDARGWAYLGSRLMAVYLLIMGVYGASNAIAYHRAWIAYQDSPQTPALYAWTPATSIASVVLNLAAAYVLWVHAEWTSKMLVLTDAPDPQTRGSWPSLAYRLVGVYTLIINFPNLVYYAELSMRPDQDASAKVQFIAYVVVTVAALGLIVGADGLRGFITSSGPGPSEPGER